MVSVSRFRSWLRVLGAFLLVGVVTLLTARPVGAQGAPPADALPEGNIVVAVADLEWEPLRVAGASDAASFTELLRTCIRAVAAEHPVLPPGSMPTQATQICEQVIIDYVNAWPNPPPGSMAAALRNPAPGSRAESILKQMAGVVDACIEFVEVAQRLIQTVPQAAVDVPWVVGAKTDRIRPESSRTESSRTDENQWGRRE